MGEGKIFLALKNQLSELERLRHTVAEFGQRHRLPARLLFEMNLALEEIVANIISYGFEDEQDADISGGPLPGTGRVEGRGAR